MVAILGKKQWKDVIIRVGIDNSEIEFKVQSSKDKTAHVSIDSFSYSEMSLSSPHVLLLN